MERIENDMENINMLSPEILGRILGYLPQKEIVGNRFICSYWREVIDEHCTVKVEFGFFDRFVDRKFQLRIRECKISSLVEDPGTQGIRFYSKETHQFAYPQSIKSITFDLDICMETMRRLLIQIKPFVRILEIRSEMFKDDCLLPPMPFVFPELRELRIKMNHNSTPQQFNFNVLFSHWMPCLKKLHFEICYYDEFKMVDKTYKGFFKFLAIHRKTIKHLEVNISDELRNNSEMFELPDEVETLLFNGNLQFQSLHLALQSRYIPTWTSVIQSQRSLRDLSVWGVGFGTIGVPFYVIAPGIESSFATLSKVCLRDVLSVGWDGSTWVPLDCYVFRDAVNLTELTLQKSKVGMQRDDDSTKDEGAKLVNLGEIPFSCLKKLDIESFVCDPGELRIIADNAPSIEDKFRTKWGTKKKVPANVQPTVEEFLAHNGCNQQ